MNKLAATLLTLTIMSTALPTLAVTATSNVASNQVSTITTKPTTIPQNTTKQQWSISKYDVTVPNKFKVPYTGPNSDKFGGLLTPGYGSAITFKGINKNGDMEFYAISDRGPNADAPKYNDGSNTYDSKIFPCPSFAPGIATITIKNNTANVTATTTLKDAKGNNITGLPLKPGQVGSTNEVALDLQMNNIGYDSNGLDTEGLAVDKDGNFWVCDEYGPFIVKFDKNRKQLAKYAPGTGLADILKYRIPNRGFEGLTITPSGKILATMQSVLDVNGETKGTATFTRIVELDPKTGKTKMYAYPVDTSKYKSPSDCKIGDICAIDDNTVLVIEQGKLADKTMSNKIYKVDLTKATDITNVKYNGKAPEYAPKIEDLKITPVKKQELVDLRAQGWTAEKAEGICMIDKNTFAIINDNDFGITTKLDDISITNYTYDSKKQNYTLKTKDSNSIISIDKNTEPAQLWIFHKQL